MSETHSFQLQSQLNNRSGDGKLFLSTGNVDYGVPPQFGGIEGKTNPEELLLAAISCCFSITLGLVFEKRKIPVQNFQMQAEAIVNRIEGQLVLTSITLRPRMSIKEDGEIRQAIQAAIERAKKACVISNTIRGNVELRVVAEINVE